VLALYRKRWQIERFFRFLTHQLGLLRPRGTSPEAAWLSVLLGAIAAVLAVLAEADRPAAVTRVARLRGLAGIALPAPTAPG
jgi:IS4 transposase